MHSWGKDHHTQDKEFPGPRCLQRSRSYLLKECPLVHSRSSSPTKQNKTNPKNKPKFSGEPTFPSWFQQDAGPWLCGLSPFQGVSAAPLAPSPSPLLQLSSTHILPEGTQAPPPTGLGFTCEMTVHRVGGKHLLLH